jgi:hypothetical protein
MSKAIVKQATMKKICPGCQAEITAANASPDPPPAGMKPLCKDCDAIWQREVRLEKEMQRRENIAAARRPKGAESRPKNFDDLDDDIPF